MNEGEVGVVDTLDVADVEVDEKEALRQSIERNEAELRDAVEDLTAAVKIEVSLAGQIVERPLPWLCGGFVVGMLLVWRR